MRKRGGTGEQAVCRAPPTVGHQHGYPHSGREAVGAEIECGVSSPSCSGHCDNRDCLCDFRAILGQDAAQEGAGKPRESVRFRTSIPGG